MKRRTIIGGMAVCGILFIVSIIVGFQLEEYMKSITAFFLWMLHGIYRGYRHLRARTLPDESVEDCSCPEKSLRANPLASEQVLAMFLNVKDMRFRTTGALFVLIFVLDFCPPALFYVLLILFVLSKIWLFVSYLRLSRLMRKNNICTVLDEKYGIAWVLSGRTGNDDGNIVGNLPVKKAPWGSIYEIFRFKHYYVFRSKSDEFFFFFSSCEEKQACDRIIFARFLKRTGSRCSNLPASDKNLTAEAEGVKAKHIAEEMKRRTVQHCFKLCINPDRKPELTDSKLGGLPYWDKAKAFPTDKGGKPMMLLIQINFSKNRMAEPLPQKGILQFFISSDDENNLGCDYDRLDNQENFRVVYHEQVDENVTLAQIEAKGMPKCEEVAFSPIMHERALDVHQGTSFVQHNAIDFDEVFAEVIADLYNEHPTYVTDYFAHTSSEDIFFDEMAKDGDEPQIQLLGHPSFTQEDPRFNSQYGEYDTLLLQIPSIEDEIMWGDMGIANFFIRKEDLERFDFSRVIYNWDCY